MLEGLYIQCYERIVSTEYHISSAVDVSKLSIIQSEYYPRQGPAGLVYKEKFLEGLGCATQENVEPLTLVIVIHLIISMLPH